MSGRVTQLPLLIASEIKRDLYAPFLFFLTSEKKKKKVLKDIL